VGNCYNSLDAIFLAFEASGLELSIKLENLPRRGALFGTGDRHLRMIREAMGVQIFARGEMVKITGSARNVSGAAAVLEHLQHSLRQNHEITPELIVEAIRSVAGKPEQQELGSLDVYVAGQLVKAKTDLTEASSAAVTPAGVFTAHAVFFSLTSFQPSTRV